MKPKDTGALPEATVLFQWVMAVAGVVLSCGGVLDDWAHFHGLVDQSFFTPWHAIMYGMLAALGTVLGMLAIMNIRKGYTWNNSLPPGYMLSLAGVVIFAIAGLLDLGWHLIFGIEHDTAAFVSPPHILLCVGGLLAGTGPLRAAWLTLRPSTSRGWRLLGPMLVSASVALIALAMFTQFASPLNDTFAAKVTVGADSFLYAQSFGVAEVIVQTLLLMSMILLLIRTWRLPFGAMTLLIGLPSIAQLIMRDHYWLIPGVLGTGLAADFILLRLRPPIAGRSLYFFTALVPALYQTSIFLTLALTVGLDWSASLIAGSVLYAAATGLLLAFLVEWPVHLSEPRSAPARPVNASQGLFRLNAYARVNSAPRNTISAR